MGIKVLIADDHQLIRQGLCSMLEKEKDIRVVAQAGNGREAVRLVDKLNPDVVILDINMPDLNGIDAAKLISNQHGDVKIIALSIHSSRRFVIGMLKAGAMAYLVKQCAYEELANAIRTVADNKSYLSPQIHNVVVSDYAANLSKDEDSFSSVLTLREREVFQLVVEGVKSKDIADRLFVSVKTVSSHRRQIMKKLNIKSVADLTRLAISEGMISADY
ncbi:MAG: response regulator transcription factor [Deltaproteobacteria bacterium]|jgi:two-component system response regulator NreC|nr:response regulator transcription factor [Deltaproteobacteria bacterium]